MIAHITYSIEFGISLVTPRATQWRDRCDRNRLALRFHRLIPAGLSPDFAVARKGGGKWMLVSDRCASQDVPIDVNSDHGIPVWTGMHVISVRSSVSIHGGPIHVRLLAKENVAANVDSLHGIANRAGMHEQTVDGHPKAIICIAEDITSRRRADTDA
jgi:hypothetical protein